MHHSFIFCLELLQLNNFCLYYYVECSPSVVRTSKYILCSGVYSPVCTECFGLVDLIEYLQVQLKLKISEIKTVFNNAIK